MMSLAFMLRIPIVIHYVMCSVQAVCILLYVKYAGNLIAVVQMLEKRLLEVQTTLIRFWLNDVTALHSLSISL